MFINESPTDEKICEVHGLSALERALVLAYLQGCVYSWCKNHSSYSASGVLESEPFKAQFFWEEKAITGRVRLCIAYMQKDVENMVETQKKQARKLQEM